MKTIITVNGDHYLIPEDQAKDISNLLDKIMAWKPATNSYSNNKTWDIGDNDATVSVTKVNDDKVKEKEVQKSTEAAS